MSDDNPHAPLAALSALAEELAKTLDLACTLAGSGRTIDLAGLDRRIGLLCAKALELPPDEGRRVRPQLIALSDSMDSLSRALAVPVAPTG